MASPASSPPCRRRRIVGVSTKMYFSFPQTQSYISSVLEHLSLTASSVSPSDNDSNDLLSKVDVFIIPDHVSLVPAIAQLKGTPLLAGAQDAFHEDRGAYTGCVSPAVLAEVGCRIVELGHAERRRLFGENDADTANRAAAAARNGMVPLVCVGERTRPVRVKDENEHEEENRVTTIAAAVAECAPQVEAVLSAVPDTADVILAYEPVWAIGAASPASAWHVTGVARGIRALECVRRREHFGAATTRILYGGSAGPGLFAKLKQEESGGDGGGDGALDGLFLGRFAHDPAQFIRTIREVAEA